ncbi:hypothetical protein EI555_010004 [Monodon monoceros]|uniref:AP-1 complex-associated regulatory protein n=1 Tax=Monodon monoceros TaxID=40151 RepID=A0A4U1ETH5_MONMO|nr:hypothetical protein EI555_010004 [Monodon monoceros]
MRLTGLGLGFELEEEEKRRHLGGMQWGTAAGRSASDSSARKLGGCSEGKAQEAIIALFFSFSFFFCLIFLCRPLTEEEIVDLREKHYDSIVEKQKDLDMKIQKELALQEEKLRLEEEALYAAQREAARAAKQQKLLEQERQRVLQQYHPSNSGEYQSSEPEDDFESCLRNIKSQYEVFRSSRLSSDATVLTPNTESSCDLMTKTKSTSGNDDSTSLDLEWEDEEGMNRMLPMRERSKTEEDILQAALKYSSKKTGSNPTSASDDSNGLEWENDFVSAEMDDNGNSEYSGFVNPVLELSDSGLKQYDVDQQKR